MATVRHIVALKFKEDTAAADVDALLANLVSVALHHQADAAGAGMPAGAGPPRAQPDAERPCEIPLVGVLERSPPRRTSWHAGTGGQTRPRRESCAS